MFQCILFDKDIETFEQKLFRHQGKIMKISFGFYSI